MAGQDRVAVVANPTKVDVDALRAALREHGALDEDLWWETTEEDPGRSMAEAAREAGATVVLAAGGDGTVRAVAEGLRGGEAALALIPAGTGNLLARNLDVTLNDPGAAVAVALAGQQKPIDLGIAEFTRADGGTDEKAFLVMGGVGLDAQMLVNTDPNLKKRAGWLAYVHAVGLSLKGGRRIRVQYALDGGTPHQARVHTLMVGNVGVLMGEVVVLPDARVDDGVLDVVALRPDGVLGWATVAFRIFVEHRVMRRQPDSTTLPLNRGGRKRIDAMRYARGTRLEARFAAPEEFELDGDEMGEITAVTFTLDPQGLRVRLP